MTAAQAAIGDRDNPTTSTPDTIPPTCYWWTDPDGDLCLLPGCMARIQDPDAECTCPTLAARLRRTETRLQGAIAQNDYARTWWQALSDAVHAHPDSRTILADARRRAGR